MAGNSSSSGSFLVESLLSTIGGSSAVVEDVVIQMLPKENASVWFGSVEAVIVTRWLGATWCYLWTHAIACYISFPGKCKRPAMIRKALWVYFRIRFAWMKHFDSITVSAGAPKIIYLLLLFIVYFSVYVFLLLYITYVFIMLSLYPIIKLEVAQAQMTISCQGLIVYFNCLMLNV